MRKTKKTEEVTEQTDPTKGQVLREAFNIGEWLESRLHLYFTQTTDDMFGYGNLTRDERITLSSAIGDALDAFRTKVEASAAQLYQRAPGEPCDMESPAEDAAEPMEETAPQEAAQPASDEQSLEESAVDITESELIIDLVEKAIRKDGTIPVKLIQSGWGSSGYYPPEVLQRDGPKVFTKGLQMFWDHPTAQQEAERPEGSLNNLAAVLVSDAQWQENGKAGPGLYADAKVFSKYQDAVNEMSPHIGLSIRANGKASQGEAAGRKGAVIQEISSAKSTDFVTRAGAGGQIISMFEAARNGKQETTVIPPDIGQVQAPKGPEVNMAENKGREVNIQDLEDQGKKLAEAERKVEAYNDLLARMQAMEAKLNESDTNNARLTEAMLVRDAREFVTAELSRHQLPEPTRKRLLESLVANPIIVDGALDKTTYAVKVREAVTVETNYLASVAGYNTGSIQGMGAAPVSSGNSEKAQQRLAESFAGLGLSEAEIKYAARIH